ncbi:aspartate aminotransferase family protein [Chloroflexota bacterium]
MNTAYEIFEKQYMARTKKSKEMYEEAKNYLVGGVSGGARYRKPYPMFVKEARGSKIWDVDGNEYIDVLCGGGPIILGHSPAPVMEAVKKQLDRGTNVMVACEAAVELAKKITQHMPGMERVRFVNSGSEACYMALRAARAYTGREKYAKFEGGWHGQLDELVSTDVYAGPADKPEPVLGCAGIPKGILRDVVILPWNNAEASIALIKEYAKELAAVIVEPIAGTCMGGLPADKSFIKTLREVTKQEGIMLIFDEVITGFRFGLSGGYSLLGVAPDLRSMGKVIGGGFPVGAYGGRRDIMEEVVAPLGIMESIVSPSGSGKKIFSSGTYSGNLVTMVAGLTTIKELEKPGFYERIDGYGERVRSGLKKMAADIGVDIQVVGARSEFTVFFTNRPVRNVRDVLSTDKKTAGAFYLGLTANGIHARDHLAFLSGAHTDADIDKILEVSEKVLGEIKKHRS